MEAGRLGGVLGPEMDDCENEDEQADEVDELTWKFELQEKNGKGAQCQEGMTLHRETVADELQWLKDQHEKGLLSETIYLERQRELIRSKADESRGRGEGERKLAGPDRERVSRR